MGAGRGVVVAGSDDGHGDGPGSPSLEQGREGASLGSSGAHPAPPRLRFPARRTRRFSEPSPGSSPAASGATVTMFPPRRARQPPGAAPRALPSLQRPTEPGDYRLAALLLDPERTSSHMISADDAEYPREYRTLGNGTRRFSNVGLVHTSERRHTVIAAQSLEALTGLQKTEMERKRDAFMDHLKSKYPQHALALRGQQERMRDQVRGVACSGGGTQGAL
ncbi:SRC kinase signaling inhibitor 1, partial [Pipra filicauda]|uniref:SRC kinase signaling inhibitor 1 n=1 Tax=Pipra filicauda TaxID=649802 RepID=A0A7R5KS89_9PASS